MNNSSIIKLLIIAGIIAALIYFIHPFGIEPWMVKHWFTRIIYKPVARLFNNTLSSPFFWAALSITFLMQYLFPADKKQKILSTSFLQDLVWFFYETSLHAIVIIFYVDWLRKIFMANFEYLTVAAVKDWGYWTSFFVGVLLTDFLFWLLHYFNHKVPWLWQFHSVHHSQKELNFFTDYRYHIVEYLVRHTFMLIPFLILAIDIPEIVSYSIFNKWYTRFYHGNIKTNMGLLRYILVTPQSHRVHHSAIKEHYDKNFGAIFTIWDFIFKTQHLNFNEYPRTGIPDQAFPVEKDKKLNHLLTMPLVQMAYPFKTIFRSIRNQFKK